MTNEEAIALLKQMQISLARGTGKVLNAKALGLAISALEERKNGKWERHYSRPNVYADLYWHCSECGYKNDNNYANVYHNFCPNCGADMRKGKKECLETK